MILGLDVGGTHTDAVLLSTNGIEAAVKVPTEPENLFNSVLSGFSKLLEGRDPKQVE